MFSCKLLEVFRAAFLTEHPQVATFSNILNIKPEGKLHFRIINKDTRAITRAIFRDLWTLNSYFLVKLITSGQEMLQVGNLFKLPLRFPYYSLRL